MNCRVYQNCRELNLTFSNLIFCVILYAWVFDCKQLSLPYELHGKLYHKQLSQTCELHYKLYHKQLSLPSHKPSFIFYRLLALIAYKY
jgi:hypothetical protein